MFSPRAVLPTIAVDGLGAVATMLVQSPRAHPQLSAKTAGAAMRAPSPTQPEHDYNIHNSRQPQANPRRSVGRAR